MSSAGLNQDKPVGTPSKGRLHRSTPKGCPHAGVRATITPTLTWLQQPLFLVPGTLPALLHPGLACLLTTRLWVPVLPVGHVVTATRGNCDGARKLYLHIQPEEERQKYPLGFSKLPCYVYSFLVGTPTILHRTGAAWPRSPQLNLSSPKAWRPPGSGTQLRDAFSPRVGAPREVGKGDRRQKGGVR